MRKLPAFLLLLVVLGAVALTVRGPAAAPAEARPGAADAQHLVAILQYLGSDYPSAIASGDQGELAEQRSLVAEAIGLAGRVPGPDRYAARIAAIEAHVRAGDGADDVSASCASLVDDLVAAAGIARAPSAPPDLTEAASLFGATCASCHGGTGHGDGPAAAPLQPKPADFHSEEVMEGLTPFKAFNVLRFGVKGTAMLPFTALPEEQRWALAFYVLSLRQQACEHPSPKASLDELANRTDKQLGDVHGPSEVACLRRKMPALDAPALLATARVRTVEAQRLLVAGQTQGAEGALLDAYLSDVEPIEPWLRARDAPLLAEIEAAFTSTRAALQQHDPSARDGATRIITLLDRAAGARPATAAITVFWFAFLVIVREGFEAAVIIAALLAVVKKRKQAARARFVHAGWLSALGVGAVVFVLGRKLLAGAMNEKLEGLLAIVAAAMLLHAALWLNARTTTRRTMGELRDRTRGAMDRGALALFGIAFLAMFRESFETAVFLEALSIDAPSAVAWGALSGALALLALVFAVSRLGLRLPMTTLFKVSTVILGATAIVLLGEGVHSFEEVALLPSLPLPFFEIPLLGIYPDRIGLLAQLVVLIGAAASSWSGRGGVKPASADPEGSPGVGR